MSRKYEVLTDAQIEHFLDKGHVILRNCFSRDLAQEWVAFAYKRLGCAPDAPATWAEARIHQPSMNRVPIRDVAPKAWGAICDLLGGEDRLANSDPQWGDGFIINFSHGADHPWEPPSAKVGGWHKDGDFFRHFLDSPEQGLLTIVVWSDIYPQSGGTFVACDSVKQVAQRLLEHPEGLLPNGFGGLIEKCEDFVELTGAKRGRCGSASPFHSSRGFAESFRPSALHHQSARRAQSADELQPGKPGRIFTS
jgi:hypothetical protein